MTLHLSPQAYWDLLNNDPSYGPIERQSSDFEQCWQFPQSLGSGQWRECSLRDGLRLEVSDYQLRNEIALRMPERPHSLEFSFCLQGQYRYNDQSWGTGDFSLCGAGMAPRGVSMEPADQPLQSLTISLEPSFWQVYSLDSLNGVEQLLESLLRDPTQEQTVYRGAMSAAMAGVLRQIWHAPHTGTLKRLYLESKALELILLLLEHITQPTLQQPHPIKPDDVERIHHAREILMAQFDDPPSLLELSRRVGLNDYALKRGFRLVFGTTAFGFLHQYRLEQAQHLLAKGDMNVTEVARAVGFADRSYFANAFRKKFGLNPNAYLRSQRQRYASSLSSS